MEVWGLSRRTCSSAMVPVAARPLNFERHDGKPWRLAISSTAMKPILCRLWAYFAPGLPRPTNSRMTRHPALDQDYFFLSPPPAGAFAPAAGALAPAAGAFAPAAAAAGAAAPAAG